jgi:hypothetical protein
VPVINFTVGDILRSKLLEAQWYKWQITAVAGPTPNAKKDGVNFTVTFTLIDTGELDGKEITRTFSNKAIAMMIPLVAAARGIKVESIPKENFQLDTDELVGKKIDGKISMDTYEGQIKNVLEDYMPYKSTSNTPAY